LHEKIAQRKKRIHPEHNRRFSHDMQLEIDCYEWVIGKIDMNKIPFDRLEQIIKTTIKDLEKRKDKAMIRTDTDNLWTKIESLQWVLFVIFAISGKMAVTVCCYFILLCLWASSSILINISGCGLINASPNLQYLPL
jgi:hypothetical protein